MPEQFNAFVLPLGSVGLATDRPAMTRQLTHYTTCENAIYELDETIRKVGGAAKFNATAITSVPTITGMVDFWRAGTAGSFTHKLVVMTNEQSIWKEDNDSIFDDITGAATITADAIPVFCVARDLLLIFDDKNDTPLKYNMTGNVASLGGTPPVGRGAVFHANRPWVWGTNANPSRITYGSSTDVEDYTGADTGSIDIQPDDGDRIIGACTFKKNLIVFKGPNKGSIHAIAGTAPTGGDAFNRTVLVTGIPLQTHNSIISVGDDVWFMSDRGIHSLSASIQFGDFEEAFLTKHLHTFFRTSVNRNGFNKVWGVNYADKGCVLWVMTGSGSAINSLTFGLSYWNPNQDGSFKAFTWTRAGQSAVIHRNSNSLGELLFGGTLGFVTKEDQATRVLDAGTYFSFTQNYPLRLITPQLLIGEQNNLPYGMCNLERLALVSTSTGNWLTSVMVTRGRVSAFDDSYSFNQGEDLTTSSGFILGTSRLGVDSLGGGATTGGPQVVFATATGQCRSAKFHIIQNIEDAVLRELVVYTTPAAFSTFTNEAENT